MTICTLPLSYCTNVHPARTVSDVIQGLNDHSAEARRILDAPMAAGLWLAAGVVEELTHSPSGLEELAQTLWQNDLCCYTLNTFPFGDFHSDRVKEQVYLPDWTQRSRISYTEQCATLLAQLLPEGGEGTLSTVPLGGRMNPHGPDFHAVCQSHLIQLASFLKRLHEQTGRRIRLAIEPEPLCELDSTLETTVPVFRTLFEMAEARNCLSVVQEYIGLCLDVCHQAVLFEDLPGTIDEILEAEIRINKVHITNAVELRDPLNNRDGRKALAGFVEPRYLHQTFARDHHGVIRHRLDLTREDLERDPPDDFLNSEAWRVHFHVPVFADSLGPLHTTRTSLVAALHRIAAMQYAPQLEVETYTWPVMPAASEHGNELLGSRIAHELASAYEILSEADTGQS
ncbi:MAG: metabolite traffic protein EboE [Planctomyces sp.]|nr:metabolite traffic protein EboE [Planctomyces sp.]